MIRQSLVRAGLGALLLLAIPRPGRAQDPMHDMPGMPGMSMPDSGRMRGSLGISMDRAGSGTTWIPEATPLPAQHWMAGSWDLMLHGWLFVQYNAQDGPRGNVQFGSLNWAMFMGARDVAGGRFTTRVMLSLDPATVTPRGYPLLLQNGETYQGQPLVDRQHPHDFWMELAAQYERPLTRSLAASLYLAPSGEPALSPVAFMHRPSAMDDAVAPLAHHWMDATHISFGVVTAGLFSRHWKLEASVFNGREPDEQRWNFDRLRLDSYSGRLTVAPSAHWTLTAGYGFLKSPEALEPDESLRRATASVMHGGRLGGARIATTLAWGANRREDGTVSHAMLLESEARLGANVLLGRAELVEKTADDLALAPAFPPNRVFRIGALSLGYIRELASGRGATLGIGGRGTLNIIPGALEAVYGSGTPLGGLVFVRLRAGGFQR